MTRASDGIISPFAVAVDSMGGMLYWTDICILLVTFWWLDFCCGSVLALFWVGSGRVPENYLEVDGFCELPKNKKRYLHLSMLVANRLE